MLSHIFSGVWIGGCDDLRRKQLAKHGITGILNVARTLNVDIGLLWHAPMEYQKVGLNDDATNNPRLVIAATDVLNDMLQRNQHVVCHCHMGQSRSATVIAAWLNRFHNMTLDNAVDFVQSQHHRPHSLWGPRPELVDSIRQELE